MKPILLLLTALACLGHAPAAVLQTNLEYGRAGGVPLLLDVSVPDGPGPFPVAVIVHGGGWNSGSKQRDANLGRDISPLFAPLTRGNFTWFSIDYRLAPTNRWPAGFDDVQTAIRWIKTHAAEFKGDPRRMALIGHSAGGHLVCLATVLADDSTRVQAVVGLAAPNDLVADCMRRGEVSKSLQNLLDLPQATNETSFKILHDISPINLVKPGLPPFLLMQGSSDRTVPPAQAAKFQAALQSHHVPCDLITITNAPHPITAWAKFDTNWGDEMVAWLHHTLAAPATSLPTLFIIGDSTVHNNGKTLVGWGDVIASAFDPAKINVVNRAIPGRSSRTFITEGRWTDVLKAAHPGDFVLMQFGHNDESPVNDDRRSRGTLSGTGDDARDIFNLVTRKHETVYTYGAYLRKYLTTARAAGLTPIVLSPVPRLPKKSAAADLASRNPHALWAGQVAADQQAFFIDLNRIILTRYGSLTLPELKQRYFTTNDNTHACLAGAEFNARCLVEGLQALTNCPLTGLLLTNPAPAEIWKPSQP